MNPDESQRRAARCNQKHASSEGFRSIDYSTKPGNAARSCGSGPRDGHRAHSRESFTVSDLSPTSPNGSALSRANPHAKCTALGSHAARVGVGCSAELADLPVGATADK